MPLVESREVLAGMERSILSAVPSRPRGLVLFFHDERHDNEQIRENAPASIARRLYASGYGIVAMESDIAAIAGTGGWSDAFDDETLDLAATRELLDNPDWWDLPKVAWGMGSGGQFAQMIGYALPAEAVLSFCAPGRRFINASSSAPTAWFLAERDSSWPNGADVAWTYALSLEERGIPVEVFVHPPTPLYEERFERVTGIDAALSQEIAGQLLSRGDVNAAGEWQVGGEEAASGIEGLDGEQEAAVAAEIRIMAGDHEIYDDYAAEMLRFLEEVVW